MKKWLAMAYLCTVSFSLLGSESGNYKEIVMEKMNQYPQYLYKILSLRNWQATQNRKTVQLSTEDDAFIHFSTDITVSSHLPRFLNLESYIKNP